MSLWKINSGKETDPLDASSLRFPRYKPQFASNEQQDSQEFLQEMLDALHEDVNRVVEKPYIQVRTDSKGFDPFGRCVSHQDGMECLHIGS